MPSPIFLLAIESSCDETSAAVSRDDSILSNLIATQKIHETFGGVVPELASRAHQLNILPIVSEALRVAKVKKNDLHGIAFTRGPGLMGSLMVGASFAKSLAASFSIPLIEVNHMHAHVLAHFIRNEEKEVPPFPFLCLTVSGGHTQIVLVHAPDNLEIIGETLDDAAGEAFDKTAKILGLPYPGGPLIDRHAEHGKPFAFHFKSPHAPGLHFSFSGLKTSIMYFIRDGLKADPDFINKNIADICASVQHTIVHYLMDKLIQASDKYHIKHIAIAGGVSANSGLRNALQELAKQKNWTIYIPPFEYCTDNAGMIAIAGYYKYLNRNFSDLSIAPLAGLPFVS